MQFPWMMYCKGPGLSLPRGQSVSCKAALDEKDYNEAIKSGWFPSVPEALAEKLDAPRAVPSAAPEAPKGDPRRDPQGIGAGQTVQPTSGGALKAKVETPKLDGTRKVQ